MAIIGQYSCGCTYGPISKRKRLKYCAVHGNDIQDEYPIPYIHKKTKKQMSKKGDSK